MIKNSTKIIFFFLILILMLFSGCTKSGPNFALTIRNNSDQQVYKICLTRQNGLMTCKGGTGGVLLGKGNNYEWPVLLSQNTLWNGEAFNKEGDLVGSNFFTVTDRETFLWVLD